MSGIKVKGIKETQKALRQFSAKLSDRVIKTSLRAGANLMLKQIRNDLPKGKTGRLKRSAGIANSRINTLRRNGKIGVFFRLKKGRDRDDPKGAFYGGMIESGFRPGRPKKGTTRKRSPGPTKVPGRHAVRNAYNANKERSAKLIMQSIERGGQQLLDALKKRK